MFYQAIAVLLFLQGANPVAAMLQRAKEYFESGAYSEARAELQQALKLAPRDATLWSYLGLTDYKLHDSEASIADFEQASAVNPHDSLNYFNLGMLHQQRGERAKALEDYRQGLALAPDDADANQSYARLLMEARRYREAIGPLERLQRNSPSNPSFRLGLAECYLRVGSNDQLDEEIQEIVKAPNSTTNDRLNLAKLLVENKQPDAARWVLEQVVQTAPGVADAHAGLGIALMDLGQNRNAATELARAVQLSPNSADYAMRYAEALLLSKQYSGAFDFLNSVKDKFGKLPEYRFKHGLACYGMSEYRCAIEELEGLLGDYPDLDRAEYYLGHSYSATGDLAKAEAHYRKAIALNPQEASYYAALGHALRRDSGEETDEAIGDLQKALQMDPSDTLSREDLAICYEKKGRYPEAEDLLVEVVREQPGLVEAHRVLARIYYRQGKKELGDQESGVVSKLTPMTSVVKKR